jgi:SAM-dependent methyltransferase
MKCRYCNTELKDVFVDLSTAPPSNSLLSKNQLNRSEKYYPLKVFVCKDCRLVQANTILRADKIFTSEYPYFSSFSSSWLKHAKEYVDMIMDRFKLRPDSRIIEVGSNDGYLLQYFKEYNVKVLGFDPCSNVAAAAKKKGIDTITDFFGEKTAKEKLVDKGLKGDLILANNVMAHVPDINGFVRGLKISLKETGFSTVEFPHLISLISENQFDTIYHEHFFYFSLTTISRIFQKHDLEIFDVQELETHGGSLRIFAKNHEDHSKQISPNVKRLLNEEKELGVFTDEYYSNFQTVADRIKCSVWKFLIAQKEKSRKVIGYGAAAKGSTLLNYCGIKGNDLIRFVCDASPYKQNKYMPGSRIIIKSPEVISETKPDYIVILPWNFKKEIVEQLDYTREWGAKFVVFVPEFKIF